MEENSANAARRLGKQLDSTISQRLNMSFRQGDSGSSVNVEHIRRAVCSTSDDIFRFARWLSLNHCLEVLLFWKEVEQYKSIFTASERKKSAEKIYRTYCMQGAPWQVTFRGQHVRLIKACLDKESKVPDGIFDQAQREVYELMRLDLFVRFVEEVKVATPRDAKSEEPAEALGDVLCGTKPGAARSFSRFAQENLCEEALWFWMESNAFALLFQQSDLDQRAAVIFDMYMGKAAKYQVNLSDSTVANVAGIIAAQKVTNTLFLAAQKEVETFLELDVFPRYQEWLTKGGGLAPQDKNVLAAPDHAKDEANDSNDRDQARKRVKKMLENPAQTDKLRQIASELDAGEAIEFYLEVQQFKLLFQPEDRAQNARRIWDKYLDHNADRVINIPDNMHRKIKKLVIDTPEGAEVNESAFATAEKEILNLMTDNFYTAYKKRELEELTKEVNTSIVMKNSGRCYCTIL